MVPQHNAQLKVAVALAIDELSGDSASIHHGSLLRFLTHLLEREHRDVIVQALEERGRRKGVETVELLKRSNHLNRWAERLAVYSRNGATKSTHERATGRLTW